jgi:hypothetical protein
LLICVYTYKMSGMLWINISTPNGAILNTTRCRHRWRQSKRSSTYLTSVSSFVPTLPLIGVRLRAEVVN